MTGFVAILRRELSGLFLQPLAWVLLFMSLLYVGGFFLLIVRVSDGDLMGACSASLGGGLFFWLLLCALSPLITMRMVSEESRSGLLEFLRTSPVTDTAIISGKLLAATGFFAVLWASVPVYGAFALGHGTAVDWGHLATNYAGAVVVSGLFCALGLFFSTLISTPILAAFVAFVVNLGVVFLPYVREPLVGIASEEVLDAIYLKVDVLARYQASFETGAFDTGHVVFFLAWIGVITFATIRLLEARRWW